MGHRMRKKGAVLYLILSTCSPGAEGLLDLWGGGKKKSFAKEKEAVAQKKMAPGTT